MNKKDLLHFVQTSLMVYLIIMRSLNLQLIFASYCVITDGLLISSSTRKPGTCTKRFVGRPQNIQFSPPWKPHDPEEHTTVQRMATHPSNCTCVFNLATSRLIPRPARLLYSVERPPNWNYLEHARTSRPPRDEFLPEQF